MGSIQKLTTVELKKLKPYEKNAKVHSQSQVEKIAESIEQFGFLLNKAAEE